MATKPGTWCTKCKAVHRGEPCPKRVPFGRKRNGNKQSGRGGRVWQRTREFIFHRDNFLCQICKAKGVLTSVELHGAYHGICDHIVPISQGGDDKIDNLQTICQSCDKEKTALESRQSLNPGVGKV
ncbi:HNH endonuclease [Pseudoalteromonas sp. SR41-8]|uniref:HNH endonuclease n=1 Tax=Pseudoalteromonas sp. SR41-8 TaxID=2760946 RepID=UPI0016027060|nr:HNH endonuclease [Pseudoalteromonas sp. SR41-8]MBB1308547.1 HNH endonuclease [Pseudoalteromonas sp. SR41-8]